jgi:tetrapyrrole methylase family protein/MazG family protein
VASKKNVSISSDAGTADQNALSELEAKRGQKALKEFEALRKLRALIATLRGEGGCPWDRKQTPKSVTIYLLEEVYEFISAVETGDVGAISEELGDVLFQVLFISHLYEERGEIDLAGVAEENRTKMIRRHPHVFGGETLTSAGDVKQRWAEIKAAERKKAPSSDDAPDLPAKLPALLKACRYFDRLPKKPCPRVALVQAKEALNAVEAGLNDDLGEDASSSAAATTAQAAGDALLHLVHTVQRLNLHPETLINQALQRQLSKT